MHICILNYVRYIIILYTCNTLYMFHIYYNILYIYYICRLIRKKNFLNSVSSIHLRTIVTISQYIYKSYIYLNHLYI